MATYHGIYVNPTTDWRVTLNDETGKYFIEVPERCECGSECCSKPILSWRPHTKGLQFDEQDEADDWIESVSEKSEADYDQYLEENHHEIAQMERYEMWRNEY